MFKRPAYHPHTYISPRWTLAAEYGKILYWFNSDTEDLCKVLLDEGDGVVEPATRSEQRSLKEGRSESSVQ